MTLLTKPVGYAIGLTVLWALLAWNSPSTTYHLAPILVAIVIPGALLLGDEEAPRRTMVTAALAGTALALGATGFLGGTDHLTGGSLLPFGGAVTEAVVFVIAGAIAMTLVATVASTRRTQKAGSQPLA